MNRKFYFLINISLCILAFAYTFEKNYGAAIYLGLIASVMSLYFSNIKSIQKYIFFLTIFIFGQWFGLYTLHLSYLFYFLTFMHTFVCVLWLDDLWKSHRRIVEFYMFVLLIILFVLLNLPSSITTIMQNYFQMSMKQLLFIITCMLLPNFFLYFIQYLFYHIYFQSNCCKVSYQHSILNK